MALPSSYLLSLYICVLFVSSLRCGTSESLSTCPRQSPHLFQTLQSECPLSFAINFPLEVNGYFLDRTLTSNKGNEYFSVLFYASWCPFSCDARLTFEALSSMFPQIEHLAVEQSSVLPSIFSRYGIHSLPAILMVNQTSRMRFRGSKDLHNLVKFYKKTTGFEPVHFVAVNQSTSSKSKGKFFLQSWNQSSLNEILRRELFLILSMLFLCLRALIFVFPRVVSHFKAFWVVYVPHLNMEIFGETSQILGRVLHMINVRRMWAKLRLSTTSNVREGAKNARIWASSLASLGESSSSRSAS